MLDGTLSGIALTAFAVAAIVAWPLRRLAWSWGFVDQPAVRKHHRAPTPMLGGVAIILGVLLPPLASAALREPQHLMAFLALVAGAALLLVVGLLDDRLGVGVVGKLVSQTAAATMIVAAGISGPWTAALGPVLGTAVDLIWLIGLTNAFNLLDNVDGLASGIAAAAAIGILAVDASTLSHVVAASLAGACLGFLIHNWSPARMFMGDAGSLPLGLVVATLGLGVGGVGRGLIAYQPIAWLLPVLILSVPILDTATVCVSRLRRGRNPLTSPGTDHLSHRLLRRGLSVRGAVSVLVFGGLVANAVAFVLAFASTAPVNAMEMP